MREAQSNPSVRRVFRGSHLALLLSMVMLAVLLALAGDEARHALRYERAAILDGEFWRLVSGHFVHLGWSHLLLNLAGLTLVWLMLGSQFSSAQWLVLTGVSLATISACFLLFEPRLQWYVGLSGLLHGWFAAGAFALSRDRQLSERRFGALLLVLIALKLAYEQWQGALPMTAKSAGGPVVVDAHLYGALGGLAAALAISLWRRSKD